jgi:hypothetical protein
VLEHAQGKARAEVVKHQSAGEPQRASAEREQAAAGGQGDEGIRQTARVELSHHAGHVVNRER